MKYDRSIKPKVGIIIVNYNGYIDTIKCLNSLSELEYLNYEVYIIDNGSTNESYSNISEYIENNSINNIHLIKSEINLGFSGGNNLGISIALEEGSEYILLLNNDTIVTPKFLSELIENADFRTIVTPRIMYWKEKSKVWYAGGKLSMKIGRAWHKNIDKKVNLKTDNSVEKVSFVSGCCMLIDKNILQKIGLLDEDFFLYYEDTEFCWRAQLQDIQLLYIGYSIIYHNVSSSTGHNSDLMNYYKIRNRFYLIDRYIHGINKILAKAYALAEIVAGIVIRKYRFSTVKKSIKDYRRGILGKRQ